MGSYYDRQGNPIELLDWAARMENRDGKVVKQEDVGDYWVSTVWLGLDHGFGDGPPLIFETMVFKGGESDLFCDRYPTEDEAKTGHAQVVAALQRGVDPADITVTAAD